MTNPFLRRATEFIRDDSTFLSIVSPDPLTTFVGKRVSSDVLFEVPIRLIGSPGSGKTMMASLVEFRLVETVLRDQSSESNRALAGALASCGLTNGDRPSVAAVRLPMESEYRDFWELPYDGLVKTRLITSLLQARTILGLFRNLCSDRRRRPEQIRFIAREGAEAQLDQIGGLDSVAVRDRARAVERAVYTVGASLIPPALDEIPPDARDPYQPFEAIREIEIDWEGEPIRLRPLVVLDDVHTLHPKQFDALLRVLARREMKFGRWMMMRLDALTPGTVFRSDEDALPGLKRGRDYVDVFMQSPERGDDRLLFRRMATDMADRYLRLVQPLRDRGVTNFRRLLATEPPRLTRSKLAEVRRLVDQDQRNLGVATVRREKIEELVETYAKGAKGTRAADIVEEVKLGMTRVLLHRYTKRIARQLPGLFENEDPEPLKPLKADADVAEAARSLLHRKFQRPFHYGLDDLCDASNENAEVFLHLAGALVSRMETRVIRGLDPVLGPGLQEGELLQKSRELIQDWRFPFADKVRGLVKAIAEQCEKASDLENARYGAGVNAVAVPEHEMPELLSGAHELATVLKFAVAYGAIVAVRDYGQGGKHWCLLELSGPVCLAHGLTLHRGGFLERRVADLKAMVDTV
ncbi:hypothetical protein [uncultured Methylobacterium sp.]|uniref:hypothetical protein n=1 Tax=uncultured Methylobacterium sp. TaxID=157278 RepID=UPI0035CAE33C